MTLRTLQARWTALALLLAISLPARMARAGAGGVVDRDRTYHYDPQLDLEWLTADGRCQADGFCFRLVPAGAGKSGRAIFGEPVQAFSNAPAPSAGPPPLESRDLWKISVPGSSPNLVMGQLGSSSGPWFIYNLSTRQFVVDAAKYDDALAKWRSFGLATPTFDDADHAPAHLQETFRSRLDGWSIGALFLSPCVLLVAVIALLLLFLRRRARTRAA